MTIIAVAGGTGNVGRTILQELQERTEYKTIALGRKAIHDVSFTHPLVVVDYGDIEQVKEILADNHVTVIISCIMVLDAASSSAQLNLVKAAAKCDTVQRFIMGDFGFLHKLSPTYALREATASELRKTKLEWTRFLCGYFLDYYMTPDFKSYQVPARFVLDIENNAAGIPGTGDDPISLTYTFDLAKFVVASLSLPKWEEITYCYGDRTTWNEFVELAEKARGSKFEVTYDPVEKLRNGQITELPGHRAVYDQIPKDYMQKYLSLFGLLVTEGGMEVPVEKALNARFPEIETVKIKDVVSKWQGR